MARTAGSWRAALALATLPCASCGLLGSTTQYELVAHDAPACVAVEDVGGRVVGFGLVYLATDAEPACVRLREADLELLVRTRGISWDQWLFGPVVPCLPVLMGASTYRREVRLDVEVVRATAPVVLDADAATLRLPREVTSRLASVERDDATVFARAEAGDVPCAPQTLAVGESLGLTFDSAADDPRAFTASLRYAPADGEVRDVQLEFERHERVLFLGGLPLLPLWSNEGP